MDTEPFRPARDRADIRSAKAVPDSGAPVKAPGVGKRGPGRPHEGGGDGRALRADKADRTL
jgi:hypothetical protein